MLSNRKRFSDHLVLNPFHAEVTKRDKNESLLFLKVGVKEFGFYLHRS